MLQPPSLGPLGHDTPYPSHYDPHLLFAVPRTHGRQAARIPEGLFEGLPFWGTDIWGAYEISWLDARGKPRIAAAEIRIPATSENIIESKSLKLYLNSLNQSRFNSENAVQTLIEQDLSRVAGRPVSVDLTLPPKFGVTTEEFEGFCIDGLEIDIDTYDLQPEALCSVSGPQVSETLFSQLLKSNCPVTGQPDWASVLVRYQGTPIDRQGLLRYIVSFRNHSGFHEQCVEQMFIHIFERCQPTRLTVYARYTRRGGLDINPFRSNFEQPPANRRHYRQ